VVKGIPSSKVVVSGGVEWRGVWHEWSGDVVGKRCEW
jgi:hypothetical protein